MFYSLITGMFHVLLTLRIVLIKDIIGTSELNKHNILIDT
jgi:hypothetical protein